MKQLNFNNQKEILTDEDIQGIMLILGKGLRMKNFQRLKSMLKYGRNTIPNCGILDRLIKENDGWSYCAGQSYPDEIRTVRNIILTGKA
jgi:S-adenosylhomocysteine hydrolase